MIVIGRSHKLFIPENNLHPYLFSSDDDLLQALDQLSSFFSLIYKKISAIPATQTTTPIRLDQ
jgi:hypothetical protein